ncbi:23S rRNA (uracil-C(5))-methyltransferase RlmCD [Paenibacillus faecis]|uniref:23S rRNA (uracil(1939)-C(5))-methyltransferase RlmD n=1 Tax=Paenibacillus faecis TaxID=862114 RepID=UPI001B0449DA|nr:23S rRNA (uracil(1939)-C(5))-methyltransferase RlmD [Paenibacillus faecis]GIO87026.1 23S rRNA (uracil-C(5))-methyltransferase RlmCD [Paenibacillus faecis]
MKKQQRQRGTQNGQGKRSEARESGAKVKGAGGVNGPGPGLSQGRETGAKRGGRGRSAGNAGAAAAAIAGLPVAKNDETVIDIIGMNHDGEGVGRAEGYTLFVQGALPGEKVRVKVLKTKKQYGYAKLLDVLTPSPDRVAAPCPIYDQCGGCQLQHWSYAGQLAWKRQHVVDALERIGKLRVVGEARGGDAGGAGAATGPGAEAGAPPVAGDAGGPGVTVLPTLGMAEPWRYRNKAQVPIGVTDGGLVGGFYARGSHRIVDMETCLIQHEHNDDVVSRVKAIGRQLGVTAYNEETGRGLLRHVVVKKAFRTGEMMLVLVTNGRDIPHADAWIGLIREQIPQVASICQNVNPKQTNVIFGDETRVLWGRDVIYDYIGEVQFAISARSFYQVNPVQTEVLYNKTVEYAGLTGKETVIDAYCGIGTISLFLAQHADQVYGVEIVKEAIEDARSNAQLNGMTNVKFEVGASEDVIPRWKEQGIEADVIVVDPPRKGCDPRLLETILEMKPERVVYVSCNPSTLARDLRVLEDGGYRTVELQPVDMFPHTVHVEAVCSLIYKGFE